MVLPSQVKNSSPSCPRKGLFTLLQLRSSNGLAERVVQTVKSGLKRTPGAILQENYRGFCSRTVLHHKPQQASLLQLYSWAADYAHASTDSFQT